MQIVEVSDAPIFNARSTAVAGAATVKTLLEGVKNTPGWSSDEFRG